MALPSVEKTWEEDLNITFGGSGRDADHADGLLALVLSLTGLANNPWTVAGSSDASTAGFPGPGWQTQSDITFVYNIGSQVRSWIVLERPISGDQLFIDCRCSSGSDSSYTGRCITVEYSPTGGYSGGATDTAPTATDSINLCTGALGVYWLSGTNGAGSYSLHVRHSTDGLHTYIFFCDSGKCVQQMFFTDPEDAPASWTAAVLGGMVPDTDGTEAATYANWYDAQNLHGIPAAAGAVFVASFCTMSFDANGFAETLSSPSVFEPGVYPMTPIELGSNSASGRGRLGRLPDIWFGSADRVTGDCYPDDGTRTFCHFGALIVPWDGSIPVVG